MQKSDLHERLLNKKEAAAYLGVSPDVICKTYKEDACFRALFRQLGGFFFTTAEKLEKHYNG